MMFAHVLAWTRGEREEASRVVVDFVDERIQICYLQGIAPVDGVVPIPLPQPSLTPPPSLLLPRAVLPRASQYLIVRTRVHRQG